MDGSLENQPQFKLGTEDKLTDWAKEPDLIALKGDLEAALPSHNTQMTKINHWNDLMFVRNSAKPKKVIGRSQVQPKLIRRQAEWRYSALSEPFLSSDELFKVDPVTFEDADGAQQNELLLNHQMRTKINRVKFIDDFVRSTVDEGTCVVRTAWRRVVKKAKKEVPVYGYYGTNNQEDIALLQEAVQTKLENPRSYEETYDDTVKAAVDYFIETQQVVVAKIERTEIVEVEEVIENRPDLTAFNPNNVIIDPSCEGDIDKAMFAIFIIETNKAELQKEGRYKNLDKVDWTNAGPLTDPNRAQSTPSDFQFKDAMRKRVIAYEYWGFYDIHGTGELIPIVCTWIGNTVIRMELNPYPDQKLPVVVVPYLPVKRELYGETDAELLEDNQSILGAVSRGMIDLLGRSANSQQGFAKGMLDPLNRRRFENGQDYEFNPNVSPTIGHIQHKYPELPQSALMMLNLQNQEAEALTGVKSFGGGLSGEAYGQVAAGIRGMLDAASKREMAILRRLARGMALIGEKLIAMNAEFLSEEEVIRVTNKEYVTIKREDLKGNFDMRVDISTAEVEQAQAQDLAFMLQTMGPNMDFGITKHILGKIADLKRMPDLAEDIRKFEPQPNQFEQAKQQAELELLQAQIEEYQSKIRLNEAKTRQIESEADLKDLDFVEQETGTKHARDIDRQRAQSRGNQDLVITKALASSRKPEEQGPDIEAAVGYNELTDLRDNVGT